MEWTKRAEMEFDTAKMRLTGKTILRFADTTKPFYIRCDASKCAIGAILLQSNNEGDLEPVEFFSRRLTQAEKNYGITEKEALAMVCACERWHHFLHGNVVRVKTDHKPLLAFTSTEKPRLKRWRLRLAPYKLEIAWNPGREMADADALSRDPALMKSVVFFARR